MNTAITTLPPRLEAAPAATSAHATLVGAVQSRFPLSFAQQQLWFLHELFPESPAYNLPFVVQLNFPLDVVALRGSLQEIVRRHEVLRTAFPSVDGVAVQEVQPCGEWRLPIIDLSDLPSDLSQQGMETLTAREASRPFCLATGPVFRTTVLRLAADRHVLLMTLHHIVGDAWSTDILFNELSTIYAGYVAGKPVLLPELEIQYADYSAWQRKFLQGERLQRLLTYWREQMKDAPSPLRLPSELPPPVEPTFASKTQSFELKHDLARSLRALSQQHGASLFMTLLAAFYALLWRYTQESDIVLGTPIANRNRTALEPVIGFFANILPLRTSLDGEISFEELLQRVRLTTVAALKHSELPLERLVEELHPDRTRYRQPLFSIVFAMHEMQEREQSPGASIQVMDSTPGATPFDLLLTVFTKADKLSGWFNYDCTRLDAPTMSRMADHYVRLLDSAAANPAAPLSELKVYGEEEQQLVLKKWNATATEYPSTQGVHELFQRQAERTPHAPAVVVGDQQCSYAELNTSADQLAHYLRDLGVSTEVPVGLCMERGRNLVTGMLAILKAGGVCVSLDPSHPLERLDYMSRDSGIHILLGDRDSLHKLSSSSLQHVKMVCLETDQDKIAAATRWPSLSTNPNQLAYLMYTSGSTGRPKGVMIPHRGICRLVINPRYVEFSSADRIAQVANASFDLILYEVWGALLNGGALIVIDKLTVLNPPAFAECLAKQRVTNVLLATALFNQVAQEVPTAFAGLRYAIFAGEAVPPEWPLAVLSSGAPPLNLVNAYGPTEATTLASSFLVTEESSRRNTIPIGRGIGSTELYVLDGKFLPVGVGITGELYIGGAGVVRGYLNQAGQTAERFLPNPFSTQAGERMYRTGDLVRWRGDGELEFLGRRDGQIKLRGFRIELGEIESALRDHEGVLDGMVVLREEVPGQKQLVAYYVGREREEGVKLDLRRYLQGRLPEYMVPSAYVELGSLPTTPNGKLDRRSLPAPAGDRRDLEGAYVAPRNAVEELLCDLWSKTLALDRVGVTDNFFELGGHSLLATQLVSKIRQVFGIELELRRLFDSPTIEGLSEALQEARHGDVIPPVIRISRDTSVPLSFAQQRLWFFDQLESGTADDNLSTSLQMRGRLNVAVFERVLAELVRRHEIFRTRFAKQEDRPVQIVEPFGEKHRLRIIDLSAIATLESEREVRWQAEIEARTPINLTAGQLLRSRLFVLSEDHYVLLLTVHHIACDGWSIGVFLGELSELYRAFLSGLPSPLPALAVQYADYAVWQRAWLQGDVLEQQMNYWRTQLAGVRVLELPTDRPRLALPSHRGARASIVVSKEVTGRLRDLSKKRAVTLFMFLMASFQLVLARWSGQDDIAVGTPNANRRRAELEHVIGFFVNSLVIRTRLEKDPTVCELLAQVRTTCLEAYSHQDVPFERLVEDLNPERNLNRAPLFQAMFALQNAPANDLRLEGITLQAASEEWATAARYDLGVSLSEVDGGLRGEIYYSTDLFDAATIERLLANLNRMLESMVDHPDSPVSELEMLTDSEKQRILKEWNATKGEYPCDLCVHELFERQAELTPRAIAVACGDQNYNYSELNERANRLARHLRSLGVTAESRVGLCAERGLDLVTGILSILKAGGVYVPLDPDYPSDRLAFMLADSEVSVLLIQGHLHDRLPVALAQVVTLDRDWPHDSANLPPANGAENAAYIIYTSGSTGKPKGVIVPQRALRNTLFAIKEALDLRDDKLSVLASQAFDISLLEMMAPWMAGGSAIIVSRTETLDPEVLITRLKEVTVLHAVPTLMRELLGHLRAKGGSQRLDHMRGLLVGGEQVPAALLREMREMFPHCWIRVLYGPTEATIVCAARLIDGTEEFSPMGRPLSNTEFYVLDRKFLPVGVGITGELYIGGAGVVRGYRNQAGQTAERFLPNPFSTEIGQRMYRTGDLVRWRGDGELEFVGRQDGQIKLRGFRIELGEIESALRDHEGVLDGMVVLREDAPGQKQLVAYYVGRRPEEGLKLDLRRHLQGRLPEYMVPNAYVELGSLPTTPNGKLDRRSLPAPAGDRRDLEGAYVAPRNAVEELLCAIWSKTLALDRVGVTDNFFELGGHSLLAIELMANLERSFDVSLPLAVLFQAPTIGDLALLVQEGLAELPPSPLVTIQGLGDKRPLFLIHPAGGEVLCYYGLSLYFAPGRPVYAIEAPQLHDPKLQEESPLSIEARADAYLSYIKEIQPHGPYLLGGWSLGGVIAFEMARQLHQAGEPAGVLALFDSVVPEFHEEDYTDAAVISALARERASQMNVMLQLNSTDLKPLNLNSQLEYTFQKLSACGVIPESMALDDGVQIMRQMLSGFRRRLTEVGDYAPAAYPGEITLFRAQINPGHLQDEGAAATMRLFLDPTHGWSRLSDQPVNVIEVGGYHENLLLEPHVAYLAQRLTQTVEQLDRQKVS